MQSSPEKSVRPGVAETPIGLPADDAPTYYRFAEAEDDQVTDLSADERLALMAVCVASQQSAGFKAYIDIREARCPSCDKAGFNTGWGVWRFVCGAEIHADGEVAEWCPAESQSGEAALAKAEGK